MLRGHHQEAYSRSGESIADLASSTTASSSGTGESGFLPGARQKDDGHHFN